MHEVKIHYEITKRTPTWGRYKTCKHSVLGDVITSEVSKGANLEAVDANHSPTSDPSIEAPMEMPLVMRLGYNKCTPPSHYDDESKKAKFLKRIDEMHAILDRKGIKEGTDSILQRQHEDFVPGHDDFAADKLQREKALLKRIEELKRLVYDSNALLLHRYVII